MKLQPIDPKTLLTESLNVFDEQKALLTAGNQENCNTMTIGWAQLGTVWGVPICTVYVRPERYTYDFMEAQDYFTVSVLPAEHKKTTMAYCGTKSGRDVDKFKDCELTVAYGAGDAQRCDPRRTDSGLDDALIGRDYVFVCFRIEGDGHFRLNAHHPPLRDSDF